MNFLCVRFKRDLVVVYHVLVQSRVLFIFEVMILLLCKMSELYCNFFIFFIPSVCPANKSNASDFIDHLNDPSFEVDENGETKPLFPHIFCVTVWGIA